MRASSEITLAALPTAVLCARLFARYTLTEWGVPWVAAESAVADLVTDTVEQTGIAGPTPKWTRLTDLSLLHVRLLLVPDGLLVEVRGRSSHRPGFLRQRLIELHTINLEH